MLPIRSVLVPVESFQLTRLQNQAGKVLFVCSTVLCSSVVITTMSQSISSSSKRALVHLKKLKPYDGWSLETNGITKQVRLVRRKVALTDNYFHDVHYDSVSGNVVGILTKTPPCQAQVLVNEKGKPASKKAPAIIYVTTWKQSATTSKSQTTSRGVNATAAAGAGDGSLSDEHNQELIKYAFYVVGLAILAKFILSAVFSLYILLFPIGYLYAAQTCPSEESFDAKKELKRVMRG